MGWVVSEGKLPKGAVKLLLNLALLAGDALVRGGRLDVGAESRDGEIELVIRAEGPRILLDPVLRETLTRGGSREASKPARPVPGLLTIWRRKPADRFSFRTPPARSF